MKLYNLLVRLMRDENGAAPVDWIALTTSALGMCLAVYTVVVIVNDDYSDDKGIVMYSEDVRTTY